MTRNMKDKLNKSRGFLQEIPGFFPVQLKIPGLFPVPMYPVYLREGKKQCRADANEGNLKYKANRFPTK
uniref:Uncharacterized protein n=1 Tax=Romanomermis culicivorax TaxID=13658 RepID=A0A915HI72_ROMCU